MSKRKTPLEAFRSEYYRTNKSGVVFLAILLLVIAIFVRWVSGSPLQTLHYIGARQLVPSIWLMVLLFSVFYIVSGAALGLSLGTRFCPHAEKKYQGAMWLCISLALGYAWYPIFFSAKLFFISLIVSTACFLCTVFATICFSYVSRLSFFLSLVALLWLLYLTLLNYRIFFSI